MNCTDLQKPRGAPERGTGPAVLHGVVTPSGNVVDCVKLTASCMPMPENCIILVVEDREDDEILIREAFERAGLKNPLFVVRDGEEAQAYLQGFGKYRDRDEFPLPALI